MELSNIKSADTIAMFCRKQLNARRNIPIRSSEMGILIFVQRSEEPVTPVIISRFFQVAKPTVTEMINALSYKGYLIKQKSPIDKRSYTISLSEKGELLVEQSARDFFRTLEALMDKMGRDDFFQMVSLMEKANIILSEETKE